MNVRFPFFEHHIDIHEATHVTIAGCCCSDGNNNCISEEIANSIWSDDYHYLNDGILCKEE